MNRRLRFLFTAVLLAVHCMATAAADSSAGAAAMPGLHVLWRVEEDVVTTMSSFEQGADEEAYPKRRVLQGGGSISYGALAASKAACYGPCPGRGQPYTGRGCQAYYQCRG